MFHFWKNPHTAFETAGTFAAYLLIPLRMETSRVDCHFHTTKSDGRYSPERAAAEARKAGLEFAAPTNHDILDPETVEALRDA